MIDWLDLCAKIVVSHIFEVEGLSARATLVCKPENIKVRQGPTDDDLRARWIFCSLRSRKPIPSCSSFVQSFTTHTNFSEDPMCCMCAHISTRASRNTSLYMALYHICIRTWHKSYEEAHAVYSSNFGLNQSVIKELTYCSRTATITTDIRYEKTVWFSHHRPVQDNSEKCLHRPFPHAENCKVIDAQTNSENAKRLWAFHEGIGW